MKVLPFPLDEPRGRRLTAAMLFTAVASMFLFGSYELIRSPAESIFIAEFGAQHKPWAMAGVSIIPPAAAADPFKPPALFDAALMR